MKQKVLRVFAEMTDNLLIDGKLPVFRSLKHLARTPPTTQEIAEYRRKHPGKKAQMAISALLAVRRDDCVDGGDVLFNPNGPPDWMHHELRIRGRCFSILESTNVFEEKPQVPCEGWLLVEDHHIVGAAEFSVMLNRSNPETPWLWEWVFIDPEHRRQGIVSRRLPVWVERYGSDMLIDQPNPGAIELLRRTGFGHLRVRGRLMRVKQDGIVVNRVHQTVDDYERQSDEH